MNKHQSGFTVIELMIVVVIVSIFATIAVPSFLTTIQNNRLTAQSNELLGMLRYARSEAIKLNRDVQACPSTNGTSCVGTDWHAGWLVWSDANEDTTIDASEILRVGEGLDGGNQIFATANVVNFTERGLITANESFQICDERGAAEATAIVLSAAGRARVSEYLDSGGALTCS